MVYACASAIPPTRLVCQQLTTRTHVSTTNVVTRYSTSFRYRREQSYHLHSYQIPVVTNSLFITALIKHNSAPPVISRETQVTVPRPSPALLCLKTGTRCTQVPTGAR